MSSIVANKCRNQPAVPDAEGDGGWVEKVQRNEKYTFFRVRTRSKAMRGDTLYHAQINSLFACMIYRGRSYGWVLTLGVILSDDEQVLVSSDLLIADCVR